MPYKNYQEFIEYLKYLNDTEKILYAIYEYFRDYVSYNYDQLQVIKLERAYADDDSLAKIKRYALTLEPTEFSKQELLQLLDEEFMKLEGRPVTPANRELFFRNYGKTIHHEAQPASIIRKNPQPAYDEVIRVINHNGNSKGGGGTNRYLPEYYDDGELLKKSVCDDYSIWMNKVCNDVGITCFKVEGKGTTGHAWNVIYIPEKDKWVNFDMTMVKFYQDGFIKEHGSYREEDWIFASTQKMFEMQPTREIYSISQDTINREPVQISEEGKPITISLEKNNIAEFEKKLNEILEIKGISKR